MTPPITKFQTASQKVQNEFLTLTTLGSYTVMVGVVTTIWKLAASLDPAWNTNWIPLISSIVIIEIYTVLTFDWSDGWDKSRLSFFQTFFIALINGLLICATCVGVNALEGASAPTQGGGNN